MGKSKRIILNLLTLIVFCVLYLIVSIFHEPWFDEAQSWQIARCADYADILFQIPHYEGHPPLWWLILSVPAKLGLPFEISLKTIGFLISFASVYLILFRSPFPTLMRMCLPFTYFVFYQYGVIVRPYGLLLFLFLLLSCTYQKRHENPGRYILCLIFLCLTDAYGMAIAGGVAAYMLWEICEEKTIKGMLRELFKDRRTVWLFVLLCTALLTTAAIFPYSNTYTAKIDDPNPFLLRLEMLLFTTLSGTLFTSNSWFASDRYLLADTMIEISDVLSISCVGIVLWGVIFFLSSKKSFSLFAIGYFFFALFSSIVYFSGHHSGIAFIFLIFWGWITYQDSKKLWGWRLFRRRFTVTESNIRFCKGFICLTAVLSVSVNFVWTVKSSYLDIKHDYYGAHTMADILKEKGFDSLRIMAVWSNKTGRQDEGVSSDVTDKTLNKDSAVYYPYMTGYAVAMLPYFDENIFMNIDFCGKKGYVQHRTATKDEAKAVYDSWKSEGFPDLLIGKADVKAVYGDDLNTRYWAVEVVESVDIWKGETQDYRNYIYLRDDLMDKYGYERIDIEQEYIAETLGASDLYHEAMRKKDEY